MRRKRPYGLLVLLVVTCLLMMQVGILLRCTVGRDVEQLQQMPALAVPLSVLRDPTLLQAQRKSDQDTLSKPDDSGGYIPHPSDSAVEEAQDLPDTSHEAEAEPENEEQQAPDTDWVEVEESWFDDALMVGDSRTVGLSQYGRLGKASYFADTGLTVFNVLTIEAADEQFSRQTLTSLLSSHSYGKIYLMLGINEIGYPFETLLAQYQAVVEAIRELQPDAKLILCANLHVTRTAAAETPRLEPDNLARLDTAIAALADGEQIFYLDVNPEFCDSEGYLLDELTGDGVHPYGTGYARWASWLKEHGIPE